MISVCKIQEYWRPGGFKPSIGKYHKWDADEIAAAKEVTGKTMMKLGYEI